MTKGFTSHNLSEKFEKILSKIKIELCDPV